MKNNKNNTYSLKSTGVNNEADINFNEIFRKIAFHWPLFLFAFVIAAIAATSFLKYKKPTYGSSAKIYIKDDKKSGVGKQLNGLEDFGFMGGSKLVENEMEVIKSPLILNEVIRSEGFNIKYYLKGRLTENELYQDLPIKIAILTDSSNVGNYFFRIKRSDNTNIEVNYTDITKETKTFKGTFNQPFKAGKDSFVITYHPESHFYESTSFEIKIDSIAQLAYKKAGELTTQLVNKQSSVFEITYEDVVPKRTADFLNAILERYNQYTLNDKNQMALNTIKFIDTRLQSLGGELNIIEHDVESFKTTRGITEIQENSRLFLEQVKEADQQLSQADIQLAVYDQIEKHINNSSSTTPFTPVLGTVDAALSNLINRHQELVTEKQRLSLSLQNNNPIIENLNTQVLESKNTIREYIAGYRRNSLTAKKGMQRKVNEIEGLIAKVPGNERQFINLKRQQSVKEALYVYLLQKKEESSVSYASNIIDNKVIYPAYIPSSPLSPNKPIVYASFILGALIITSAFIYLKYSLSNRISSKKDIEKIFDFPIMAEVYKEVKDGKNQTDRSVLKEQILNLKNNLKFSLANVTHSPVILFTSSISGEGKTFLSLNFAKALTSNNKKVVVLEFDLRKPKLSSSLNISNSFGYTNYIIGQATLDEVVREVPGDERLYILPSGPVPPNPIELLESTKMKELFNLLRAEFDYIVVDTSPIGLVSDAKSLSPFVDYTLFVTRFDYTPIAKLIEVSQNLSSEFFERVGIIFNGVDLESASYFGYGYSAYGYGYGNDTPKTKSTLQSLKGLRKRLV